MLLFAKASTHAMFHKPPTDAQKESGKYPKLPLKWHGLNIRIEHPEGTVREGVDETGKPWRTVFRYAYGEIRGTEGMDGDPVDVFIGQHPGAHEVYIVQQMRRKAWSEQDEEKVMLNFASIDEAKTAYLEHYDDPRFFGGIRAMPVAEFIDKVKATKHAPGMVKAEVLGAGSLHPGVLLFDGHEARSGFQGGSIRLVTDFNQAAAVYADKGNIMTSKRVLFIKGAHGALSESMREKIGTVGSEHREDEPADAFLEGAERKYPVKTKVDGAWKYSPELLLAAARRARMQGREDLASRADAIRAKL